MATKQSEQKVASKQPPGQKAMSQYRTNRCLSTVIKPLRIFQFVRIFRYSIIPLDCTRVRTSRKDIRQINIQFSSRARCKIKREKLFSHEQLVMLPLFAFALFMTVMDPTPINFLVCIILIVLSGGYLFVLGVEVIAQFASSTLPIYPVICARIIASSEIRETRARVTSFFYFETLALDD